MPNEGGGGRGGLGGGGNYQRRRAPSAQPHTEHGANIRGPVESGGYSQGYLRSGRIQYSPPSPHPFGGALPPRSYTAPAPRGYAGRGPSGRQVFHTYAGWQAVARAQAAAHARAVGTRQALTAFGGLAGTIERLLGKAPGSGAPAGAHADYRRGVGLVGGLLRATQSPQAAGQAGRVAGFAAHTAAPFIASRLAGPPTANLGKTKYSGLEAVPGDVLGAAKDVGGYVLGQAGNRSLLAGGPLGGRLESQTVRNVGQGALNALNAYGHAAQYPGGPLQERIARKFGADRPAQIAGATGYLADQAVGGLRSIGAIGGPPQLSDRIGVPGIPKRYTDARQRLGASVAPAAIKDYAQFYGALPSLAYGTVTDPVGTAKQLWQTDPILSSIRTGSLSPLAKGLREHPLLTLAELHGGTAAGHRLVGTAGRAVGRPQPGAVDRMGSAFYAGPEQSPITTNALRGRGQPGKGRVVLSTEPQFSRYPLVNAAQRRAEVGRIPGQRVLGGVSERLSRPAAMRRAGVPEATIRARERVARGQTKRADFIEEKRIVRERMGRHESALTAGGGIPRPGLTPKALARYFTDKKTFDALAKTHVAYQILENHAGRPGHLVEDLKERLAKLSERSRDLPDNKSMVDANLEQRKQIAGALGHPELAKATAETVRATKVKGTPELALLERPYKDEPVHPDLGVKVGRGFRWLETHATMADRLEREMTKPPEEGGQGLMREHRLKSKFQPGLQTLFGARRGTKADEYLTDAGERAKNLRDHVADLNTAHGEAVIALDRARGAAAEAVRTAQEEAATAKGTRKPGAFTVEGRGGKVRVGRAKDASLRTDEGPVAVKKLEQALRSIRTHLRNRTSAVRREDFPSAGRHHALAKEAEKRAIEAARNLSPRVVSRVQEAIANEHAAEAAMHDARAGLDERTQALAEHEKMLRDTGTPEKRTPWMVTAGDTAAIVKHEAELQELDRGLKELAKERTHPVHATIEQRGDHWVVLDRSGKVTHSYPTHNQARGRAEIINEASSGEGGLRSQYWNDRQRRNMELAQAARRDKLAKARGTPIETEAQARQMLGQAGVHLESTAHISERPGQSVASSRHAGGMDYPARGLGGGKTRSGEAADYGLADSSHEAVVNDIFRKRTRLEWARANVAQIANSTVQGPLHSLTDAKQAQQDFVGEVERGEDRTATGTVDHEGMPKTRIVDLGQLYARADDLERRNLATGAAQSPEEIDADMAGALRQVLEKEPTVESERQYDGYTPEGSGRYALVLDDMAQRMLDHAPTGKTADISKAWRGLMQDFRKVVLLTSTRWFAGNMVEMSLRLLWHGIGPKALVTGHQLLGAAERVGGKEGRDDLLAATTGFGAHFGTIKRFATDNSAERFRNQAFKHVARAAHFLRTHQPIRAAGALWDAWATVFGGLNTLLEHQGDIAIMGAQATRDVRDFNNNVLAAIHVGRGALEDTAKGLMGTARQERYARRIDYVRGQYSRFSPLERRALEFAPFFPWYRNALKFLVSMPVRHPVKTAVLAGEFQTQYKDLQKGPLSLWAKSPWLAAGYQQVKGGHIPFGRYTPFGATDPSIAGSLINPLASGALGALAGQTFSGQDLGGSRQGADLDVRVIAALNSFAESLIPGMRMLRLMQEGGGASGPTSTLLTPKVKVGSKEQGVGLLPQEPLKGLEKFGNPFHKIPQATSSTKSGGVLGGGSGRHPDDVLHQGTGGSNRSPDSILHTTGSVSRFASYAPQSSEGRRRTFTGRAGSVPQSVRDPILQGAGLLARSGDRVQGDIPLRERIQLEQQARDQRYSAFNQRWDRMTMAERNRRALLARRARKGRLPRLVV